LKDRDIKDCFLICGEDPRKTNVKHFTDAMEAIYKSTDIRRINVEAAPMTVEDYRELKKAGIGTYVISRRHITGKPIE